MELKIGDKVEISMTGVVSGMQIDTFSKRLVIVVEGYDEETYLRASITPNQVVRKEEIS